MRRCESCNRPLRDPQSRELGYGPGCWARLSHLERTAVRDRLALAAEADGDPVPSVAARSAASATGAERTTRTTRSQRAAGRAHAARDVQAAASGTAVASATPAPAPCPPRRSDSALAVIAAWTVGLLTVLGLAMFWQWVLLGAGVVAGLAVTGLLIERVQERRLAAESAPTLVRSVAREADELATAVGSRTVPTTPSGAL
jgi:hypothetical protein